MEFINGVLFVVCLGLAAFYGSYLWRRFKQGYRYSELKIGFALWIYVLGDGVIRAPVWYYRHMTNIGEKLNASDIDKFWTIATIGAIFSIVGGLCALRVSAPDNMRPWPWIVTMLIALVVATAGLWMR